ncbi:MAG: ribonuclease HII [Thermodesulfovibrionales bacterium]
MDFFSFDSKIRAEGFMTIAGVDEAGRGPLAGPVVASAVIFGDNSNIHGLNDSKKLTPKQRESVFWEVVSQAVSIGIGVIDAKEIDCLNILNATKKAMAMAIDDLSTKPDLLIIDAVRLEKCTIDQKPIIKGDATSASIAADSVIAKYFRDWMMKHYHTIYPHYGFDRHKGYGTKSHIEKITKHGPCPIHRLSFSPVASMRLPYGDA